MHFSYFYFGAVITLGIYHFFIFLGRKYNLSNLSYSLLCLVLGFLHFTLSIYPEMNVYNETIFNVLHICILVLLCICANFFVNSIFDIKKTKAASIHHYIITPTAGLTLILLFLITGNQIFRISSYIFIGLSPIAIFTVLAKHIILKKNYRSRKEKIIITGYSILNLMGFISLIFYPRFPLITFFIALQFAYALADGFNVEYKNLISLRNNVEEQITKRTQELEAANKALKSLDKSKDMFIENISHELRTPLTLIRMPVETIIDGKYGKSLNKDNKIFKMILGNTNKLIKHITDLLDFSRIKTVDIKKEKIDIIKLIKLYISEIDAAFISKNIKLSFKPKENSIFLDVDQYLFESVISNLLSNALKFTPNNGNVNITCGTDAEKQLFSLSVSDSGIGITLEDQALIFNRFYQVNQTSNYKSEGTGIGLSLIKEIIERHNGTINVKSQISQGSTFTIIFPYVLYKSKDLNKINTTSLINKYLMQPKEAITISTKEKYDNYKKNILIVEDSISMQNFLISFLNDKYNINCAENGKKALEAIPNIKRPHLIISDIMMPHMDGKKFYSIMSQNKLYNNIPFLFLTARVSQSEKEDALKQGVFDYLFKPFSIKELEAKIDNLIKWNDKLKNNMRARIINEIQFIVDDEPEYPQLHRENIYNNYLISPREIEIVEYVFDGLKNKEIADKLCITKSTVSNHIQNIYSKLDVKSRTELMGKFINA